LRAVAVAPLLAIAANTFAATAAHADTVSDEAQFVAMINAVRAANGAGPLVVDEQLVDVARSWSGQMAAAGDISHNPNLRGDISGGRKLGENVGMGPSVPTLEDAFENSPHHFANMVDPAFNRIGVGIVESGGTIFVTEDYKQDGGAPVAAPAPKPAAPVVSRPPVAAPKPVPKPAPAPAPVAAPVTPPSTAVVKAVQSTPKPSVVWQVAGPAPVSDHGRSVVATMGTYPVALVRALATPAGQRFAEDAAVVLFAAGLGWLLANRRRRVMAAANAER
jgi:hypothetical protein